MNNPVSNLLALGRVPAAVAGDIKAIAEAALRVSVIERTLMALLSELQLVGGEITRVRSIVEPQQKKVSSIEQMLETMSQRTAVIEQTLLDLKETVDAATDLLPDPDSDGRGPLLKAKDAITGG
jgi:archaellum component FlaC